MNACPGYTAHCAKGPSSLLSSSHLKFHRLSCLDYRARHGHLVLIFILIKIWSFWAKRIRQNGFWNYTNIHREWNWLEKLYKREKTEKSLLYLSGKQWMERQEVFFYFKKNLNGTLLMMQKIWIHLFTNSKTSYFTH